MNRKLTSLLCVATVSLFAKVVPAPIFVDNMVLQRERPVPVWGTADAGEQVTVSFAGQNVQAKAGADGAWMVKLAPLAMSKENRVLTIQGDKSETIAIQNVLVGEVWLCSGQSNMEMPMWNSSPRWRNIDGDKFVANGANPLIRISRVVPYRWEVLPRKDFPMKWEALTADNGAALSACAFFYGRELQRELDMPIGLVTSHWGGTRIEPWTPPCGFDSVPELAEIAKSVNAKLPGTKEYTEFTAGVKKAYAEWLVNFEKEVSAGQMPSMPPAYPKELVRPANQQQPTVLYNAMIFPFVPFAFRGVIWYQGCANLGDGSLYRYKMQALFNGWKQVFQNPDLQFFFVQLAPYTYGNPYMLPVIWEAQQAFAEANAPAAGMAVINDVGNLTDIHPHDKETVGKRLAALALNRTYGRKDVTADSPVATGCKFEGPAAIISFKNVKSWKVKGEEGIKHFTLAGLDGVYYPATAEIIGTSLKVTCKEVAVAKKVRFMWHQHNEGNLYNEADLPAGAFRYEPEVKKEEVLGWLQTEQKLAYRANLKTPMANGNTAKYDVDNSKTLTDAVKRVTYLLEAKDKQGKETWISVSMDAFVPEVAKLGIPSMSTGVNLASIVKNVSVYTNVPGIPCGIHAEGNIEFWPHNYGTQNNNKIPGGDAQKYDFSDSANATDKPGYGCMQVHLNKQRLTLFAFNNFNSGVNADFGIGNAPSGHPDWTFSKAAQNYESITLSVYVK